MEAVLDFQLCITDNICASGERRPRTRRRLSIKNLKAWQRLQPFHLLFSLFDQVVDFDFSCALFCKLLRCTKETTTNELAQEKCRDGGRRIFILRLDLANNLVQVCELNFLGADENAEPRRVDVERWLEEVVVVISLPFFMWKLNANLRRPSCKRLR